MTDKSTQQRGKINLSVGEYVIHSPTGTLYRITKQIDFNFLIAVDELGNDKVLPIVELGLPESKNNMHSYDLNDIEDEIWAETKRRRELIEPIVAGKIKGRKQIEAYAKDNGIGYVTLYRWYRAFNATNSISSLIPKQRGWQQGASRLSEQTDNIISEAIEKYYLSKQRLPQKKVIEQIRIMCHHANISMPAENSIRKRMNELSEKDVLRGRGHREKAKNKFQPKPGQFPDVSFPLDVIQIDHTPVDIILVDDKTREPIGRPWLTIAIDIYSRMICGYYLSLDAPSEVAVAMCISHCVLPKEDWLSSKGVEGEWKVWGLPRKIHVDNGADFRSETLKRACLEYGITLEYRPVRVPNYGGHIERLIGTFMREIHQLSGTTFSNIHQKDNYNSTKEATMTFDELEKWLLNLIVNLYHKRIHSSLSMRPEDKWNFGIFGDSHFIGSGLPEIPTNPKQLMLDFMPFEERTIQANGVTWDGIRYFDFSLSPYINHTENNKKTKFIFRRDPRDISVIYFYNPDAQTYIPIPTANHNFPRMSLWQLKETKNKIKQQGLQNYNEHQIIETMEEMQRIATESSQNTLKARRKTQRNKLHQRKHTPIEPLMIEDKEPIPTSLSKAPDATNNITEKNEEIIPFEDIE